MAVRVDCLFFLFCRHSSSRVAWFLVEVIVDGELGVALQGKAEVSEMTWN